MKQVSVLAAGILFLGVFCTSQARAASITTVTLGTLSGPVTNSGTLPNEAQVIEETFNLTSPSTFTVFTTSYGGGTNLNGTTTSAGGFEPMLSLFNSAGNFVAGEAVTSPIANTDSTTGLALDAYLKDSSLAAGSYILVLTDFLNQQPATATNLSSGFTGPGGSSFIDEHGNSRTAAYTLNISATPTTTTVTPEPATTWLVMLPLGGALWVLCRRRSICA